MRKVGTLKRLVVALGATTVVLVIAAVSGAAPGTEASISTFDQCANGGPPSTSTACPENWINGILNANNSHYAEDDVTPQRVILELPKDSPATGRTVEISYLTRKGGVHAYDSLATWNHTQTSADRCANLPAADCVPGSASTLPVPGDPTVVADNDGSGSATSGHQLAGQVFTLYGGTLTGASSYTHDDASGTSDSFAHITLTYSVPSTADGAKVMLLFGGHIAPGLGPRGWGAGVGAGSISGGPYHVRITAADGASVGNRDNQIMSGAILSPANIVIRKNTVGGDATFNYAATGGISSGFSIATSGGTGSQSFTNISAGSYTVTESALPAGWDFTNLACLDEDGGSTVDLVNRTANIDLDPGETVTCTYTNTFTPPATIDVQKTANPTSLLEPGGNSNFSVTITNQSSARPVTITSLVDNVYGNLDGKGTCDVPQTIAPNGTYSCQFTGAVSGAAGSSHTDVVTASGTDDDGNPVSDFDDATVTITNSPSSITVIKTATPTSLLEPGGNSTFSVTVQNTSAVDQVTISSLVDNVYGNLDGKGTCDVSPPVVLAPGAQYQCSFTGAVAGNAGTSHTDTVTASGQDDDGNPVSDSDDATVTITNSPSSITVIKTATPTSLLEPGGNSTFSVTVQNTSAVDQVTISSLVDNVYGNLDGKGTCDVSPPVVLAPGAQYQCSFTGAVAGNAGTSHTDTVTASGQDDDGNPVSDSDDATVTITNSPSSIEVTKEANPTSVQAPGGNVAYSVKVQNTSDVDMVSISSLLDDKFGNLNGKGTCDVMPAVVLAPGAEYTCMFTGAVSGSGGTSHVNTVTASGEDDDGNPVSDSDDATVAIIARPGQGTISVSKSANPTAVKEPGGQVAYSVRITNTSADVDVHITNVVDDKFGDLDDDGGNGCFDVPINLAPGQFASCQFTKQVTGVGGTTHVNTVTASGTDENGNPVSDSDDATVSITERLIDLVIVKDASSPTSLNGIVNYSLTVTNKGPDTATNVQLADPAPAGITYLTANPSQGTCNLSPALITCSLGSIAAGQTVTIAITGRATTVGSHTNTATVTGGGGRETNPADNVDSAVTLVPAPLKPPTVKPPTVEIAVCLSLTVTPKMIKADGRPDKVTTKVTAGKKRVKGVKVVVSGAGVSKAVKTNGNGVAVLKINPRKPGLITVAVVETNQKLCGPKRIGVVGVFLPPLTG